MSAPQAPPPGSFKILSVQPAPALDLARRSARKDDTLVTYTLDGAERYLLRAELDAPTPENIVAAVRKDAKAKLPLLNRTFTL